MGAANVGAAYLMWSHLPDGAFRMLAALANHSLDQDQPGYAARRWYKGEDDLISYVRQVDNAGNLRSRAARRSAAYRYLDQLREAGAITVLVAGARNRRAVYVVNVDPMCPSQSDVNVSEPVGREVSEPVGHEGSEPVGHLGTTKEPLRNHGEDNHTSRNHLTSALAAPVDDEQGWTEVALVDAADTSAVDAYDAASSYLERTIGAGRAGAMVAAAAARSGVTYAHAVVAVAVEQGWRTTP